MKSVQVNYDDQPDDVIEKINEILKKLGIEFKYNDEESAEHDGSVVYDLVIKV